MKRINKVTLQESRPKAEYKPKAAALVFLNVAKVSFNLSRGLYLLLDSPLYVEFVENEGNMYIMKSDRDHGFKITHNVQRDTSNAQFRNKQAQEEYFKDIRGRLTVFKEAVYIKISEPFRTKVYQIRMES
jgi:hypothetical protein